MSQYASNKLVWTQSCLSMSKIKTAHTRTRQKVCRNREAEDVMSRTNGDNEAHWSAHSLSSKEIIVLHLDVHKTSGGSSYVKRAWEGEKNHYLHIFSHPNTLKMAAWRWQICQIIDYVALQKLRDKKVFENPTMTLFEAYCIVSGA